MKDDGVSVVMILPHAAAIVSFGIVGAVTPTVSPPPLFAPQATGARHMESSLALYCNRIAYKTAGVNYDRRPLM